ncbi:unnamed protein product [Cylindrotheca closterium]|uniref:Erythromycin biosynthesis protein CIII-like C-terminal domain-containing protein n=1 Tax=Cylindrotheca closterium TaxID=2856 RepID=A0AAD2PW87_9STRA|nr:unnamed protein product [Cylindrotheca closterium]
MKVLLVCVGSRGDAEPFVAIADRLLQDSHQVEFVIQPELKELLVPSSSHSANNNLRVHEWPFTQYDFYKYAANPSKGANLEGRLRFVAIVADCIGELVLPSWKMVLDAAKDCNIIITSALARPLAFALSAKLKIPSVLIHLQPLVPTKLFPHSSNQDDFIETLQTLEISDDAITAESGLEENLETYWTLEQHQHDFLEDRLDKMYKEMEIEPKMTFTALRTILSGNDPSVFIGNSFFDEIIPRVVDAGPNVRHISSLADHYIPQGFEPPQNVVDFLNQSTDKPICVGFGSMPYSQVTLILKALKRLDGGQHRAILIGKALELPKPEDKNEDDDHDHDDDGLSAWVQTNVLQAYSLPYAWLLPQCQMMLSHGGAGVTHATLRAGIPPVISPLMGDQFFFAELLQSRGLGARAGQSLSTATEDDFVQAMEKAMGCVDSAKQFGEEVRNQPLGVDNLMNLLLDAVKL